MLLILYHWSHLYWPLSTGKPVLADDSVEQVDQGERTPYIVRWSICFLPWILLGQLLTFSLSSLLSKFGFSFRLLSTFVNHAETLGPHNSGIPPEEIRKSCLLVRRTMSRSDFIIDIPPSAIFQLAIFSYYPRQYSVLSSGCFASSKSREMSARSFIAYAPTFLFLPFLFSYPYPQYRNWG